MTKKSWYESWAELETSLSPPQAVGEEDGTRDNGSAMKAQERRLYKACRLHLKSCFPSLFESVGRSRGSLQQRFRFLLHELNQCFPVPARLPRRIFDDKFVFVETQFARLDVQFPSSLFGGNLIQILG